MFNRPLGGDLRHDLIGVVDALNGREKSARRWHEASAMRTSGRAASAPNRSISRPVDTSRPVRNAGNRTASEGYPAKMTEPPRNRAPTAPVQLNRIMLYWLRIKRAFLWIAMTIEATHCKRWVL